MKLPRSYVKRRARIEIVPLIDIIFFLLATFVMVSLSMVKNEGIPVNLPTAQTAAPQERKDSVTVSVTQSGEIFMDKVKMTEDSLKERLRLWKTNEADPKVFIHGDENAPFKFMMQVMDAARSVGIVKVAMQTQPDRAETGVAS